MTVPRFDVEVTPHEVVTLVDGTEISLRVWRPRVPPGTTLAVVLEALPYRKDDLMLADDDRRHRCFAEHGFVGIRMDLRGTGSSTGVLDDEASAREADDIAQVIAWAAAQPWSNGAVGLLGMSWGGMNALRVATLRPPALRTVVTAMSTDDRYRDNALYRGGALVGEAMLSWGAYVQHIAAYPPDPRHLGERWRDVWRQRLAALPDPIPLWAAHPRRDAYWRWEEPIEVPVLAVGGWADPFHDAVLRLLDRLGPDTCGIIGPWGHTQPYDPVPGPAIGWLQECVEWFDRHLRGTDAAPPARLRFFTQDAVELTSTPVTRPGEWCEADGSDFGATRAPWRLDDAGTLSRGAPRAGAAVHRSPLLAGSQAGDPMPRVAGFPAEQTADDALALAFTSLPLAEPLLIAGRGMLRLRLAADRENVTIVARLTDVHPDGRSFHITSGVLDLAHRDGHGEEDVAPVEPGEWADAVIDVAATATRIPAGHRLRLAISTQSWPWLWPLPEEATIRIDLGSSWLDLPQLASPTPLSRGFAHAQPGDDLGIVQTAAPDGANATAYPHGLVVTQSMRDDRRLEPHDPLSAEATVAWSTRFVRDESSVSIESDARLSCTDRSFVVDAHVVATEGGVVVHEQRTHHEIPRDFA